jgi:hypothetical protein
MRALRVTGALVLALYGASYLWLTPAAVPGAGGPLWALVDVLAIASAAGFMVAGWGLARAARWRAPMAVGAAIAGLVTIVPYLAAVQDAGTGDVASRAALHGLGSAAILLALLLPPAERLLSQRAKAARDS